MPRQEVIDCILQAVPAEGKLGEVIAALVELRISTLEIQDRELVDVLSGEIGLPDRVLGSRLPLVPSPYWVEQLRDASGVPVLVDFLCASGLLPQDLPQISEFDYETGIVRVGERHVVVDTATAQAVRQTPSIMALVPEEVEARLLEAARRTGLKARYKGLGRTFTATCLRYAFASRLWESGLDLLVLHHLLGNRSWTTTECFAAACPGVHRAAYLKFHPLANDS